jgi:two-component system nitrogen regulation response regulator GlnG/two-component system response regulator HydG
VRDECEREVPHLVIAWSRDEPHRIGEAARIDGRCVLGRGLPPPDDPTPRAAFYEQRPGGAVRAPPLEGSRISRRQIELTPLTDGGLAVHSVGRCPLILRDEVVEQGVVRPGETITLQKTLVLLVVRRPLVFRPLRSYPDPPPFPFGAADPHGIVGESPAAWALRDALAFAAKASSHVLLLGASGAGKELAARALHALSARRAGPFVARNASTFPEGLIDAELFGTAKGYPNAGSIERRGLIAEADGGALFLDEISELPTALQVHLLRVLDKGGEYHRLGETRARRASFRLIAAPAPTSLQRCTS